MYKIYETYDFRTKIHAIRRMNENQQCQLPDVTRRHLSPNPTIRCQTFKFEFNMADDASASHVSDRDAGNGLGLVEAVGEGDGVMIVDGHESGNAGRRAPFLIGVAGGTASGKVAHIQLFHLLHHHLPIKCIPR